jgi:hypothetical protein
MLVFQSSFDCPYIGSFPMNFTKWDAFNSTLIYITTHFSPLTINYVKANGNQVYADAWWQTGTSWETGWPITIPPNQIGIIQVNHQADTITLETGDGSIATSVFDGWKNPPPTDVPSEASTIIFTPKSGNYLLASKIAPETWHGKLSIRIDNQTFTIGNSPRDSPYAYVGPISLTTGNHTISISTEHDVTTDAQTPQIVSMLLYSLKDGETFENANELLSTDPSNNTSIAYQEINPTQYTVKVKTSEPFYLVFSESYDNGWVATINGQQIPDQYHFTANGYANGWYINKTGTYTITLEFTPQNLFYTGAAISITTLIICTAYVSKNKIKNISRKYIKKDKTLTTQPI